MILKKCATCKTYTLKKKCATCKEKTSDAHYKYIKIKDAPKSNAAHFMQKH